MFDMEAGLKDDLERVYTLRDWFAAVAPEPDNDDIKTEMMLDNNKNPYNEGHKPQPRTRMEIIADLRYKFADAMIKARSK